MKRKAPHNNRENVVFCSLEPCIGCFRRLSTNKPNGVWIATPDEYAGAMLDGREQELPTKFWRERRESKGIEVMLPSDDPTASHYINPAYRDIATEMFFSSQTGGR